MNSDAGEDRIARDAIERSWAVAALDEQLRLRARHAAAMSWERLIATSRAKSGGRLLTRAEQSDIQLSVQAYERAALERIDALLRRGAGSTQKVRQELRAAASELFGLARVLPLPEPVDPEGLLQALRLGAIAVIADRQAEFAQWRAAHAALELDELPERWDAELRRGVAIAWTELLTGPTPESVERAFERLGALRERRAERENELLATLPLAGAQQMRLHLIALYGLAEAAAGLVVHLRRGPHAHVFAQLARQFETVRGTTTGDSAFDRVVPWLHIAADAIAARHTAQIPLPGLLT